MHRIDVLAVRTVTFFMFTAIPMIGLNSAPKISDMVEIAEAMKNETKDITQIDLVIGVGTGMVATGPVNVNPIVMIEIIRTDDGSIEADREVTAMMIIIVRKNDGIAVEVEVIQKDQIKNNYLEDLVRMGNR